MHFVICIVWKIGYKNSCTQINYNEIKKTDRSFLLDFGVYSSIFGDELILS